MPRTEPMGIPAELAQELIPGYVRNNDIRAEIDQQIIVILTSVVGSLERGRTEDAINDLKALIKIMVDHQ